VSAASESSPLLSLRGLSKSYGPNRVLEDVTFGVLAGEAVAVIGENGAGKSTLAKILAGVLRPDRGELLLNGAQLTLRSPRDALRVGISFIPQELAYLSNLTVAENVVIGRWPSRGGVTSLELVRRRARAEVHRFGIDLDVSRRMASLTLAERQIVEVVKAIARQAKLLVLDEPTASLNERESSQLFAVIRTLTRQGVGVIYISHRMDEVYRFSDRVQVLRNGRLVASVTPSTCSPTELIAHMLGKQEDSGVPASPLAPAAGQPALQIRGWSYDGTPRVSGLDLTVNRGEIVGLFGLRGCGAELVAEGLAGLRRDLRGGEVVVSGRPRGIFTSPRAARTSNVSVVPPERKSQGLVLTLSLQANIGLQVIGAIARFGLLKSAAERALATSYARQFGIRHHGFGARISELSGGNQQKALIASRLANRPHVLVLQEPTRGVDVGARAEIQKSLRSVAEEGTGILWVTSDVEEAVAVSDRVVVMRNGAIVAELSGADKTQAQALAAATIETPNHELHHAAHPHTSHGAH
jgi:ribose transport system ATP-binding protein